MRGRTVKTLLALFAALILAATFTTPAAADNTPPTKHGDGWCC